MKKVLFIDRDGTIIKEPPIDYQVDSLEKLEFCKYAISSLREISKLDFEMAMVTNQDGLGTESFPTEDFELPHQKMLDTLLSEDIAFDHIYIDDSFESENSPNRKPRTGMLTSYMDGTYSLSESYVIGDRLTDIELAKNLGAKAIYYRTDGVFEMPEELKPWCILTTDNWRKIYEFLRTGERTACIERKTRETDIRVEIDLDGRAPSTISSGVKFLDHMLEQIVHHAGVSLSVACKGDLHVDEHHTIEDIAIVFGAALRKALGSSLGIGRYGFVLPMDECDASVVMDLGGRIDFVWRVDFHREMIGDCPTEMFEHFFKSFAHSAQLNLHIEAHGKNEHHKIEGVFKAFARALKAAVRQDPFNYSLPSSKGVL